MAKSKTSSYVVEIPLCISQKQNEILASRFAVIHHISNVLVRHAIQQIHLLERNAEYKSIMSKYKSNSVSKENKIRLNELRLQYGLSEYQFHNYVIKQKHMYEKHINIHVAQKIATKVWISISNYLFGKGKQIHFKKLEQINSYEGKNNETGIIYRNGYIINNGLKMKLSYRSSDILINQTLCAIDTNKCKVKFCRIVRKFIRNKYKYYVQLVIEGEPIKKKNIPTLLSKKVGIDIGPSTIAVVSDDELLFEELGKNVTSIEKKIARLHRKLDRQRRINNPQNYRKDGTIRKDSKTFKKEWNYSKRMIQTKNKLRYLYQKRKNQLKLSHTQLANRILQLGSYIIVEDMQWSALSKRSKHTQISEKTGKFKKKKRFGKSIANHAPRQLINILERKLNYINLHVIKVDCFKTAATKFNHTTGELMPIELHERFVTINNANIQRDLHSAFNLQHILIHTNKTEINYSYDIDTMNLDFVHFLNKYNILMNQIQKEKQLGQQFPSCMGI